jgi:hypothetical protein
MQSVLDCILGKKEEIHKNFPAVEYHVGFVVPD